MPIKRGKNWVPPAPGMIPKVVSGNPNVASLVANLKSQHSANSNPPPRHAPWINEIVGNGRLYILKNNDLIKIQNTLNNYELEQLNNKKKKEELYRYERELREKQINDNKLQKEHEKFLRITQEKGEMLRAKRMSEQEEEEKQLLKLKQKHDQEILKLENEKNKEIKNELLRERQNYEKKLNSDYE